MNTKNKPVKNKWVFLLVLSIALNLYLMLPIILAKVNGSKTPLTDDKISKSAKIGNNEISRSQGSEDVFEEINPTDGYSLNVPYGKLGPKMIDQGVIDFVKFKDTYANAGQPLTTYQEKILAEGTDDLIVITSENSYFLLNFFWAVGLSNKSKILTEGEMMQYGGKKYLGSFASTGGWSLGKSDAMEYFAKGNLIVLSAEQETIVNRVAKNIYRPCCNNSTIFPDCNHGMALLGILELMAANNASEDEMYKAAEYINAYWFPANYYDLAVYFKNKENKSFSEIDPRVLLSRDYSSASASQVIKQWLVDQGIVQEPPKTRGGCGV